MAERFVKCHFCGCNNPIPGPEWAIESLRDDRQPGPTDDLVVVSRIALDRLIEALQGRVIDA